MRKVVSEVESSAAVLQRQPGAVTIAEQRRSDGFELKQDAEAYLAARILARQCVTELTGAELAIAQRCDTCGEDTHGRPFVVDRPDVYVSWSHSSAHVIAAAGYDPIGVDLEDLAISRSLDLKRFVTPTELASIEASGQKTLLSLKIWVAKEALFKAGGIELDDFATTDVDNVPGFNVSVEVGALAVFALAEASTVPESRDTKPRPADRSQH